MSQSDTPRTDDNKRPAHEFDADDLVVHSESVKVLERELAAAQANLAEVEKDARRIALELADEKAASLAAFRASLSDRSKFTESEDRNAAQVQANDALREQVAMLRDSDLCEAVQVEHSSRTSGPISLGFNTKIES